MKDKGDIREQVTNQLNKTMSLVPDVEYYNQNSSKLKNILNPEQGYGEILEYLPEMIFKADITGNFIFTNKAWSKYTKYPYSKVKPKNIFDLVHLDNLETSKKRFAYVFESSSSSNFEFKVNTEYSHGTPKYFQIIMSPILDSDGNTVAACGIVRDITEQHNIMGGLIDSEKKYRNIIDNSPALIYTVDLEGTVLSLNYASKFLLGYDAKEIIGKNFKQFFPKETLQQALKNHNRVSNGTKVMGITAVKGKNEERRYFYFWTVPILENGQVVQAQGIAYDVTSYMRTKEKVRRMFEATTDGILVTDLKGLITELNERTVEIFEYDSKDELIGKSCFELFNQFDHDKNAKKIKLANWKEMVEHLEYELTRGNGNKFWVEISACLLIDAFGEPTGFMAIIRDISERKYAEELLRMSQDRLRLIIMSIPDLLFHVSRDGTLLDEPMGKIELLSCQTRDKFAENKLNYFLDKKFGTASLKAIRNVLESRNIEVLEFKVASKSDQDIFYEARIVPCGKDEVMFIVRDITDRKQSEERIQEFQHQLQSVTSQLVQAEERERRRLALDLHDLIGQTLAVVKMRISAWEDTLNSSGYDKSLREVQKLIKEAIGNTKSLTFDLSPFILYELGLEAGIESLLIQFQTRYSIQYEFKDDGQKKPLEKEVRILLYRCVSELLMNVLKHANAKFIRVVISRVDWQLLITIEDDGIGFDIIHTEKGNLQFGLISIQERVNWIGGSFSIFSEPGSGTIATLKAPLNVQIVSK